MMKTWRVTLSNIQTIGGMEPYFLIKTCNLFPPPLATEQMDTAQKPTFWYHLEINGRVGMALLLVHRLPCHLFSISGQSEVGINDRGDGNSGDVKI